MSNSIRQIMAKAYKNVLSNPREAKFAWRMQRMFKKSETRRKEVLIQEGLEVPPLLISSIATTCNPHCKGAMGPVHSGHPDDNDLNELKKFTESFYINK